MTIDNIPTKAWAVIGVAALIVYIIACLQP